MLCLLALAIVALGQDSASQWAELKEQDRARYEARGDAIGERKLLMELELPLLESARADPELLWRLLTDPATPQEVREATALRCPDWFDPALAVRLVRAQMELEREQELHYWGLREHPLESAILEGAVGPIRHAGETRRVLGQPWEVPCERTGMPFSFEERSAGPWPWRVQQALGSLASRIARSLRGERAEAWLAACMEIPLGTPADAMAFVRATRLVRLQSSPPVIARWRAIVLDGSAAEDTESLLRSLAYLYRMGGDAHVRALLRVLFEDALRGAPTERVRAQAAYGLRELSEPVGPQGKGPPELPIGALLAACELAADPQQGSSWTRLYCFAFSVCEALPAAPIEVDRRMVPGSPEAEARLAAFLAALPELELRLRALHDPAAELALREELDRLLRAPR